jgi:hypothetical protein
MKRETRKILGVLLVAAGVLPVLLGIWLGLYAFAHHLQEKPNPAYPWLGDEIMITGGFAKAVVVLGVVFGSARWAAIDADRRGKSSRLIGWLVFLTWPFGLLFWLAARPPLVESQPSTALPPDA